MVLAGLGTFAMRSIGHVVPNERLQARWLEYVPFAVLIVLAASSIAHLSNDAAGTLAAAAATTAVIATSAAGLPLLIRIGIGCAIYGALAGV